MENASNISNGSITISTTDETSTHRPPMFMEDAFDAISPFFSYAILVVGFLGIIGNILTLIIYCKMGFSQTIHMSYVALAVSDIGCILTVVWMRLSYSSLLQEIFRLYRMKIDPGLFSNFTTGWLNLGFSRTTALLTSWISLERCLCVLLPTKVKVIINPKVTKVVLSSIYTIGLAPVVFAYVGFRTKLVFDPATNYTTLLMHYNEGNKLNNINRVAFFLYGAFYPVLSWVLVIICAAFLITKLKQSSKWRNANSHEISGSSGGRKTGSSQRENRVTRTVVMIAWAFIILSTPSAIFIIVAVIEREFSLNGYFHFPFLLSMALSLLFSEINSSINIIVYAITGSKFRATLVQILPRRCQNRGFSSN